MAIAFFDPSKISERAQVERARQDQIDSARAKLREQREKKLVDMRAELKEAITAMPPIQPPHAHASSGAMAAVPPPHPPHAPVSSGTEGGFDAAAVVSAFVQLPPWRNVPHLQQAHTSEDKWLNWARPMGSASPRAVALRHRYPAKRPSWQRFQKVLSAHLASAVGSHAEETRLLMALHPLVKDSQLAYFNRDSDSESE